MAFIICTIVCLPLYTSDVNKREFVNLNLSIKNELNAYFKSFLAFSIYKILFESVIISCSFKILQDSIYLFNEIIE